MSHFGKVEYWNERYSFKNERYEWYVSYEGFRHLLTPELLSPASGVHSSKPRRTIEVRDRNGNLVPRSVVCPIDEKPPTCPTLFPPREQCRVLIVGCGNSQVGEAMMRDGWTGGIVNVDFSDVVIQQMKERSAEPISNSYKNATENRMSLKAEAKPMEFICADVTDTLPFSDASFDLVICKGTLDSLLCGAGSFANAKHMMHECCRVLRDRHGAFVVVSHANMDNRIVFFENPGNEWWAGIGVHSIPKAKSILMENRDAAREQAYVYVCRKRAGAAMQPASCSTEPDLSSGSISRSASNEENDATISTVAPAAKAGNLKMPSSDSHERRVSTGALTQMQVSVMQH